MKKIVIWLMLFTAIKIFSITPEDIIKKADEPYLVKKLYNEAEIQIEKNGKLQPIQVVNGYSTNIDGINYSLTVYKSPKKMKGTANLMIGDDLWVKFASTGRVRKLSSSAKKNSSGGSDFTYADMGSGGEGIAYNYEAKLIGEASIESQQCYEIELTPTENNEAGYDKLIVYVNKENNRYVLINYYEDNANSKTLTFSDYREVEGLDYSFLLVMRNHMKDSITSIITTKIMFNSDLVEDSVFTQNFLKKVK